MVGDRSVAVALLWTATVFLAGCLGGGSSDPKDAHGAVQLPPSEVKNEGADVAQPARIEGLVKDSAGAPVPEVLLGLKGAGNVDLQASSDAEGKFVFEGLPNGTYAVTATKLGYEPAQAPFVLSPGETKSLEITIIALAVEQLGTWNTTVFDGTFACGLTAAIPFVTTVRDFPCATVQSPTGHKAEFRFEVAAGAKTVVAEFVWTPSGQFGAAQFLGSLDALGPGGAWREMNESAAGSPISIRISEGERGKDESYPFEQADQNVTWRVLVQVPNTLPPSFVKDQPFKVYVTAFWGQVAPRDFTAVPA